MTAVSRRPSGAGRGLVVVAVLAAEGLLLAHGRDARYVQEIPWRKGHVTRAIAASRSELGLSGSKRKLEMRTVDDQSCAVASLISFDADDGYAFDVDEPVDITLTYAPNLTTAALAIAWDRNGGEGYGVSTDVNPDPGAALRRVTLRLERARLANGGILGTDLAVGARNQGVMGLCDIDIARSSTTRPSTAFGRIRLDVVDVPTGRPVPARVGLYDVTGRTPLPSADAVPVHRFADEVRLQWLNRRTFWPSDSRQAFYINGTYEARVAAGTFDLIVARGPEYRVVHRKVDVRADETSNVHVQLDRYADLPSSGWFSGDSHIHRVFERTRSQGALTGYAHLGELFNGRRGLALDVPFGLVDFIEVLQGGRLNTNIWYSFLNLGYKVLPVAGADFPYFGPTLPGVERTYVKIDSPFSADAWYAGFRRGRVYVTNGPLLQFAINGREMGEELHVTRGTRLEMVADARLNPDVDKLDRVELVVLGDVEARESSGGSDHIHLQKTLVANHSMWVAVRAYGYHQEPQFTTIAHTAPIYVVVDQQPTWKVDAVPALVAYQRAQLNELLTVPIDPNSDLEAWETGETLVDEWPKQLPLLRPRIEEADKRYRLLLERLQQSPSQP